MLITNIIHHIDKNNDFYDFLQDKALNLVRHDIAVVIPLSHYNR